jgi:M6 family metalloprotease-like protein
MNDGMMNDGMMNGGMMNGGEARVHKAPKAIGTVYLPPKGLVILAAYQNVPYTLDSAAVWDIFNKPGYAYQPEVGTPATGSVADYFRAQSNGAYVPEFDVIGPVTLPSNRATYGGAMSNAAQMIIDACEKVRNKVDFSQYDFNNDNRIDFVYVLYAGVGANDYNGPAEAVWAHQSIVNTSTTYNGKRLASYVCSGEIDGVTLDRTAVGTICHEFSHMLGMPDYYDADGGTNGNTAGMTPKQWSPMDEGCYNNYANTPPNYSLYDKEFMGWLTPKVLEKDAQETITLGTGYDEGYKIAKGDTVYYIENRQISGWDQGLYGHGLIVWRLVYNASVWSNNRVNSDVKNIRFTVAPADGGKQVGWLYKKISEGVYEDLHLMMDDVYPGNGNRTSLSFGEGYDISDISEAGGLITFKLNGGGTVTGVKNDGMMNDGMMSEKVLIDGKVMIIRGDKAYNILGMMK